MKNLIKFADDAFFSRQHDHPVPNIARGVGLSFALVAMQITQSFCQHHFFYRSMMVGAMARTALIGTIYRKSLKLSNKVLLL
jgi:ATP-binding cassette, subfamily C (CFTR/MRP), member 1